MKYFKSYPCENKDINILSLDILEDIMIRMVIMSVFSVYYPSAKYDW